MLESPLILATAAAPDTSAVEISSVWDFVMKGGPLMIPIGVCSLIALAILAERLLSLRKSRVVPNGLAKRVDEALDAGKRDEALEACEKSGSPAGVVLSEGVRRLGRAVEVVEKAIAGAGEREVIKLRKNLRVLSVIAAAAPLMGLLGTIFGMIRAFQTVAQSAEALGKTELLAEGIYEAMITTAAGLIVAIPALIFYHWMSARAERVALELDAVATDFVDRHVADGPAAAATSPANGAEAGSNGSTSKKAKNAAARA